jgi:hypothetical protein
LARRLLRLEIPVWPERKFFRIFDPAIDPDGPVAPSPPLESLTSSAREQMIVACAQDKLAVQVTLEEWDEAPPPFSDGYEDDAKCVLYLGGRLSLDEGAPGPAITALRLAGGAGDYGVRVYTRNRAETVRRYSELFLANSDPLSDEFPQALKMLEGLEQYLIQIWRES